MNLENRISTDKNVLVVLSEDASKNQELQYLMENFCGKVVESFSEIQNFKSPYKIYACGDLSKLLIKEHQIYIIEELSLNFQHLNTENHQIIPLGAVPVVIHKVGVYFRSLFDGEHYFNRIETEHVFQNLTESNKQAKALRKGIYLTEVLKDEKEESLHYRLLRCSSNLTGPTDNFRTTDHEIVNAMNDAAKYVFEEETKLNHVLAQIYTNKKKVDKQTKESKAKIKAHSDKTKDMPPNGLIAFCTFYDESNFKELKPSKTDRYNWCYKKTSGLTKLHFKLKNSVKDSTLIKDFSLILYPNSVFLIPLSTNRLYTHEIKPSLLNIDRIPTRMGYVVRCSKTEAVFTDNQTYIKEEGTLVKLEEMTLDTVNDLRSSYYEENKTKNKVEYGKVHFSMNLGDYQKPIY